MQMKPAIEIGGARVFLGDCRDVLKGLPNNSVDSIVTDPPYELGFMGKKWDNTGIAYDVTVWAECLRVLKPGGHILAFGGSRTWHRLAVALEDAGFELRDSIAWIYGSGFPKSLDVSKAIDKKSGYEGDVIGSETVDVGIQGGSMHAGRSQKLEEREIRELSPEAKQWQGWGTALKPAFEPVVVGRKPFGKGVTVAENVLAWGVGGLNIDGSRIGGEIVSTHSRGVNGAFPKRPGETSAEESGRKQDQRSGLDHTERVGRWPANVILDEVSAGLLDEQSGVTSAGRFPGNSQKASKFSGRTYNNGSEYAGRVDEQARATDSGGASRFFYVAKASKRDRNEGLEELEAVRAGAMAGNLIDGQRKGGDGSDINAPVRQNFHPTVKPTQLMRYLIKLVTPAGGVVLDPFTGSGSTGKAALLDGYGFIGAELTEEYLPIIEGRLKWASEQKGEDNDTLF
jgi:DNA modification methylase